MSVNIIQNPEHLLAKRRDVIRADIGVITENKSLVYHMIIICIRNDTHSLACGEACQCPAFCHRRKSYCIPLSFRDYQNVEDVTLAQYWHKFEPLSRKWL